MSQKDLEISDKMAVLFASFVRTIVPLIVVLVVRAFAGWGIELGDEVATALDAALTAILTSAYYLLARLLEVYVSKNFGWLLGIPKAPTVYEDAHRK